MSIHAPTMRSATLLILLCLATTAVAKPLRREDASVNDKAKGCEWAGPGYVKLDGTDTCVKLSGGVRAEFSTSK